MLNYTTDHPASSYGIPVLVDAAGNAYGEEDLIGTTKAAELLNVTPRRVLALIYEERLPAQMLGRDWFVKAGDLKLVEERPTGWPKGKKRKE